MLRRRNSRADHPTLHTCAEQVHPANAPSGYTPDFEDWWTQDPVKAGKTNAFVAWKKAIKKTSLNELHQGLGRYKQHLMLNPDVSIKHAQGWLNDERWTDEYQNRARGSEQVIFDRYAGLPQ